MSRAGKLYPYRKAADELGYRSPDTISRLVEEGLLERIVLRTRDLRITGESIDDYIKRQRRETSSLKSLP